MELGEATRTTTYIKSAVHRPPSHMTLMGKVLRKSKCLNKAGSQIPGDLACKTSACGCCKMITWL
jgi:hypothetical protein